MMDLPIKWEELPFYSQELMQDVLHEFDAHLHHLTKHHRDFYEFLRYSHLQPLVVQESVRREAEGDDSDLYELVDKLDFPPTEWFIKIGALRNTMIYLKKEKGFDFASNGKWGTCIIRLHDFSFNIDKHPDVLNDALECSKLVLCNEDCLNGVESEGEESDDAGER